MDLCNQFCPAGMPACCLVWQNFKIEHYIQTFQPNSFVPAMFTGTISRLLFYTTFSGLDYGLSMAEGHKISTKQTLFVDFLAHISTDQDEVCCSVEAVQAEHCDPSLELDIFTQGIRTTSSRKSYGWYACQKKKNGTHSDLCAQVLFKLGVQLDIVELCILIQVLGGEEWGGGGLGWGRGAFILIQDHKDARK